MSAAAKVLSLPPLHPSLVLSAYSADLVVGARIALFGDATLSLTSELVERGARLVHVFDIDAVRAAEAGARGSRRSVVFGTLPRDSDIGSGEPAFDLVFVPDLSFTKDPKPLLRIARRILSPAGAALIASPNTELLGGEGLGYYELYDAVAGAFRRVRMVGQAPFVGYLLAELSATEELSASIDTSLAGAKEPEWFIALAGQRDVRFEPYVIIELPAAETSDRDQPEPFATIPAPPPVLPGPTQAALDAARAEAEARAATAVSERNRALADAARASSERDRAQARENELLQALAEEKKRAAEAEAKASSSASALKSRAAEIELLREQLRELETSCIELEAACDQYEPEITALEARLRERGQAGEEQRREAARRGRLVRELVSLVEDLEAGEAVIAEEMPAVWGPPVETAAVSAPPPPVASEPMAAALAPESAAVPTALADGEALLPEREEAREDELADLQRKLDVLAREAARREADLTTASWKIAELERRLAKR